MSMGFRQYAAILVVVCVLCTLTWLSALWLTRARVDFRLDSDSGLVALYLAPESGVSLQWSEQGYSAWAWTPESNRRLWPGE
jgi:hypothetical protein